MTPGRWVCSLSGCTFATTSYGVAASHGNQDQHRVRQLANGVWSCVAFDCRFAAKSYDSALTHLDSNAA